MQTETRNRLENKTARQLAAEYRAATIQANTATDREAVNRAHAIAAEVWQEAQARKGKDAAVFHRIVTRSY